MRVASNRPAPARGGPAGLPPACTPTLPLFAVGVCSLIWQVAAARAILTRLHGNELTLGLVLGSWLVLTGLATAGTARFAKSTSAPSRFLASVLLLLPVGLLLSLVLQQAALPSIAESGQVMGPGRAVFATLVCLAPCCLPLGAAFALASLRSDIGRSASARGGPKALPSARVAPWAARLFMVESLGTVAAGLAFHFWLAHTSLAMAALVGGGVCWLAAAPLLRTSRGRIWLPCAALGIAALVYLVPGLGAPGLQQRLEGYDLLEQRNSPHAELAVARRGDQLLFLANGVVLFSNQDHQQAESDVHLSLLAHRAPRRVLMIGGGLGGGLAEALKHPVERVDYVELDPALIALVRRFGGVLAAPLADRRVRLLVGDGRLEVRRAHGQYDVILVGMPGPSSALLNRYYTTEFLQQARQALRPGGLLRVVLAGKESLALDDRMALVHASVRAGIKRAFGHAVVLPGGRTFMFGGKGARPEFELRTLVKRLRDRKVKTRFISDTELADRTMTFKHQIYLERLDEVRPLTNTDLSPAVYFRAALSWVALTAPGLSTSLTRLADTVQDRLWLPGAVAALLGLLWGLMRRRQGRAAAGLAMGAAGLTGLAVELALLLGAQGTRGVIYHEMAALLTAFMAGLALGAPVGRWLVERWPRRALQLALGSTGLASVAAVGTLALAYRYPGASLPLLLGQMLALGAAVGATYPAASTALARSRPETAAARAYAWDLLGAALGAVLAASIALPVLGLPATCFTCAALCLAVAATVGGECADGSP